MATDFGVRNRTKLRLRKIVGMKVESLPRIFAECFCASGGYDERDFFRTIFGLAIVEFSKLTQRTNQFGDVITVMPTMFRLLSNWRPPPHR